MGQENRLRPLQVGVAGHDHFEVPLGLLQEGLLEGPDIPRDLRGLGHEVQAQVERHLFVPAPAGVELAADVAHLFDQPSFNVHVDVLVGGIGVQPPFGELFPDLLQAPDDPRRLVGL